MKIQNKKEFMKEARVHEIKKYGDNADNSDFFNRLLDKDCEFAYEMFQDKLNELLRFIKCQTYPVNNVKIELSDNYTFAVAHNDEKIHYRINEYKGKWYISAFNLAEPDDDFEYKYGTDTPYDCFANADFEELSTVEHFIAFTFEINAGGVNTEVIEPVTKVMVHKVTGFPIYRFNCEGNKYIATIDKVHSDDADYTIQIRKNNKAADMLDFSGVKTGRTFKTVLLKRLNDWFKETFNKRAQFTWGDNITMQ